MADFDLTQTDAQVQSILNAAQDAQGAGAQTTLTTDYIMLKGTNGRYHKIQKDSFTEAVRNVLAGLLVNNDKGTTISQIAAIASGDFGSVTPANLASVLGAFVTLTASESSTPDTFEDIARLRKNILMAVPTAVINTGKFQDMPERSFGFLINLFIGGNSVQFYVRDSSLNIYCRAINGGSGAISSWFKLTNTPV